MGFQLKHDTNGPHEKGGGERRACGGGRGGSFGMCHQVFVGSGVLEK